VHDNDFAERVRQVQVIDCDAKLPAQHHSKHIKQLQVKVRKAH